MNYKGCRAEVIDEGDYLEPRSMLDNGLSPCVVFGRFFYLLVTSRWGCIRFGLRRIYESQEMKQGFEGISSCSVHTDRLKY